MRRIAVLLPALVPALAISAGCAGTAAPPTGAPPSVTTVVSPSPAVASASPRGTAPSAASSKPAAASWPTPEDCIAYNPSKAAVRYDTAAGAFIVEAGSVVVMRVHGDSASDLGDKALALAKRYSRHCFLGRRNNREEKALYIFDYWRGQVSGAPEVPGRYDDCSSYDRTNLTVEDMGNGDGWRVKDHDHVLHLFDNESDARNGKLVLSKYRLMCFIGDVGGSTPGQVSYQL